MPSPNPHSTAISRQIAHSEIPLQEGFDWANWLYFQFPAYQILCKQNPDFRVTPETDFTEEFKKILILVEEGGKTKSEELSDIGQTDGLMDSIDLPRIRLEDLEKEGIYLNESNNNRPLNLPPALSLILLCDPQAPKTFTWLANMFSPIHLDLRYFFFF
jgi:hypothetical protein